MFKHICWRRHSAFIRLLNSILIGALSLPSFALAQERILVPTTPKNEQTNTACPPAQRPELVLQTGVTEPAACGSI